MTSEDSIGSSQARASVEPIRPQLHYPDPRTANQRREEAVVAARQSAALDDRITSHEVVDEMISQLARRRERDATARVLATGQSGPGIGSDTGIGSDIGSDSDSGSDSGSSSDSDDSDSGGSSSGGGGNSGGGGGNSGGDGGGPVDVFMAGDDGRRVLIRRGEMLVQTEPVQALQSLDAERRAPLAVQTRLGELGYSPVMEVAQVSVPGVQRYVSGHDSDRVWADIQTLRSEFQVQAGFHVMIPTGHVIKGTGYPVPTQARRCYGPEWIRRFVGTTPFPVAVIGTGITPEDRTDGWLTGIERSDVNVDPIDAFPPPAGDGRQDFGAGHETFVAGIVEQVAPACDIRVYRAADSDGLCSEVDLAVALVEAARQGALVINVSLGTSTPDDLPPTALEQAVELITYHYPEVLVVASAGNEGTTVPLWPAAFKQVVAVGALEDDLSPAPWSQHGFWVDVSAVGVGVTSTFVPGVQPTVPEDRDGDGVIDPDIVFGDDAWALWSGTSFSAPQICGAVAVRCQLDPALGRQPRAALRELLAGQPYVPGYGRLLRILPGTPTTA